MAAFAVFVAGRQVTSTLTTPDLHRLATMSAPTGIFLIDAAGDATFASGSAEMTDAMLRAIALVGAEFAALPTGPARSSTSRMIPETGASPCIYLSGNRPHASCRSIPSQGSCRSSRPLLPRSLPRDPAP